ncbi:MAG: hypothetical protein MUQ00_02385 [Candidatus Aminicenantes bacterium]|nr:hypothetical protein [Candidatus Aminicenantes bacterium]
MANKDQRITEQKYDPGHLMTRIALHYAMEGKMAASVDHEDFKKIRIVISKKDPRESPFIITKDPDRSDATICLQSGTRIMMNHSILENEKDVLGSVSVFYEGRSPVTFDTYPKFVDFFQI